MSTRVTQNTRLNAACRELVGERLNITLGQSLDLGQVRANVNSARLDLSSLRSLAGNAELGGILGRLAPMPFARAEAALGMPANNLNLSVVIASARSELADAITIAGSAIDGATRDLTVEAFTGAAQELGYTYSTCRGADVTGIELWQGNELLLLRVHDGGAVESDHAGIADASCGDRQRQLEAAVERRGIAFTGRKQYNHGAQAGGDLIAAAVARGDQSLARATVTDFEQPAKGAGSRRRLSGRDAEPSHLNRERRRGGAA